MKCAKCNSELSIADSKCPKCGHDLLQFGSTVFYDPKSKDSQRYGQGVKGVVFGGVGKETADNFASLDADERRILLPIENRLKSLFERHLSDEELEEVFFGQAIPLLNDLKKDSNAAKSLKKIETIIRSMIGDSVFQFYENPGVRIEYTYKSRRKVVAGRDILDILRMGELVFDNISNTFSGVTNVDFSAAMFAYFKAPEVACLLHSHERYADLHKSDAIESFLNWLGNDMNDVYIEKIPAWLGRRKRTLFETVHGIYNGEGDHINGCLRIGIAIYVFGRNWVMELKRSGSPRIETYQLKNYMNALGKNDDKEALAADLSKLQAVRNPRVHNEVEKDKNKIVESRRLSYDCLKGVYRTLEI